MPTMPLRYPRSLSAPCCHEGCDEPSCVGGTGHHAVPAPTGFTCPLCAQGKPHLAPHGFLGGEGLANIRGGPVAAAPLPRRVPRFLNAPSGGAGGFALARASVAPPTVPLRHHPLPTARTGGIPAVPNPAQYIWPGQPPTHRILFPPPSTLALNACLSVSPDAGLFINAISGWVSSQGSGYGSPECDRFVVEVYNPQLFNYRLQGEWDFGYSSRCPATISGVVDIYTWYAHTGWHLHFNYSFSYSQSFMGTLCIPSGPSYETIPYTNAPLARVAVKVSVSYGLIKFPARVRYNRVLKL